MGHRIDPELTRRARELRNNPTPAELAIWHRVSRYRPAFTRQLVVPPFIIDLGCRRARLVSSSTAASISTRRAMIGDGRRICNERVGA